MMKKLISLLLLSLLSFSIIAGGVAISTKSMYTSSQVPLQATKVLIEPQNGTATVGASYTITVKVANVTNLYGFDIQIRWGTAVLKYISHTVFVGQTGGVLNPPTYINVDEVNEASGPFSVPGAVEGTTYWISSICLGGAVPFNGTGIVFTMTFEVIREGECDIYFTKVALSNFSADPIPTVKEDGYFYQTGLVQVPVADFTFFPDPAVQTKSTTFDASVSYDPDAGGDISLYIWNFGDGTRVNSTSPIIYHNFTTIPYGGYYSVELTVLDDQGGGSQSKPEHAQVYIVHPRPVAQFTVWPEDRIAVVDKVVTFNASESYDPDPGGGIVEYRWDFGDSNLTDTPNPIITHRFQTPDSAGYTVQLIVLDDSDGLESNPLTQQVVVVQRRDIEVVSVTASPDEVR
ncbi:MAG: PKD domain-containing protein, partial [Candidatus Bathyarchaeia archaeon]